MRNTTVLKISNIATIILVLALLALPLLTNAQLDEGFVVPDSEDAGSGLPNDASFSEILIRIINILLGVAGFIAVIFLIVGGFRYITSGGNEEASEQGKKTIINAVIGLVVIILSFVIVRIITNAFGV